MNDSQKTLLTQALSMISALVAALGLSGTVPFGPAEVASVVNGVSMVAAVVLPIVGAFYHRKAVAKAAAPVAGASS